MEEHKIKILLKQKEILLQKISDLEEIRAIQESEIEEQEKIIELMADKIYNISSIADMLDIAKEVNYDLEKLFNGIEDKEAIKIIIDYFKKKARTSNEL